ADRQVDDAVGMRAGAGSRGGDGVPGKVRERAYQCVPSLMSGGNPSISG
ncbi:MAG: hypothetical protein QOG34_768, partial [Frankiaceae bacterium]|nr:hypothetical protein [Frankiaceae bacterium]